MQQLTFKLVLLLLVSASCCRASDLAALSGYHRPDPFGGIVASDSAGASWDHAIKLSSARGGYVSFQLVVKSDNPCKDCRLSIESSQPVDVYREWFHSQHARQALLSGCADSGASSLQLPNARSGEWNRWTKSARILGGCLDRCQYQARRLPWPARGLWMARLARKCRFTISVLPAVIPAQDIIDMDANSYGIGWMREQYPKALAGSGRAQESELFRLIQAYHRIFYENRGIFHQLAYAHNGHVNPEFVPELDGTGAQKHIVSWDKFDRLFGPLLDGSAFADTRRGPSAYPVHVSADQSRVASELLVVGRTGLSSGIHQRGGRDGASFPRETLDRARNSRCSSTRRSATRDLNGMETRREFPTDYQLLTDLPRSADEILPANTPVHFVMRADVSWSMGRQMHELKDAINMWCAAGRDVCLVRG